ncbi:radical SAM enzyme [Rozella allomycis CSF55]|uniref:Radical S-adenosyl methionine domain-containing protein 1, mitochondrial n=1 Tax=Rozella allomycis (strain CSF55) TaxID=988480 RepID=A0A4P9YFS3_ROZAC|nr:radical SAM enzyme [Rozella allomycis CSF55]
MVRFHQLSNSGSGWHTFSRIHVENANIAHNNPQFLPWHRHFLYLLENELRKITPGIALPYWDSSAESEAPERSIVFSNAILGFNLNPSTCEWPVQTPNTHCLSRALNSGGVMPSIVYEALINNYPIPEGFFSSSVEDSCRRPGSPFDTFRCFLEVAHGYVHNMIGGDMAFMYSPNDPAFYLHHAFIDKIWHDRQTASNRPNQYDGMLNNMAVQPTDLLSPWGTPVSNEFDVALQCVVYVPRQADRSFQARSDREIKAPKPLPMDWIKMQGFNETTVRMIESVMNDIITKYNKGDTISTIVQPKQSVPIETSEKEETQFFSPYCLTKCTFCNFNKYIPPPNLDQDDFVKAYLAEIKGSPKNNQWKVQSIYFGGGTPGLMNPSHVHELINGVRSTFDCMYNMEITIECNPTNIEMNKLLDFKKCGVNRLSLGIQTLNQKYLSWMNRSHTVLDSLNALEISSKVFPNKTTFDLMYGLPFQDLANWKKELNMAESHLNGHVSVYQLTVEKGTPLHKLVENGAIKLPDDDTLLEMHEYAKEFLRVKKYNAYEISNYASSLETESKHNKAYWMGFDYLGFGPGAHGRFCLGNGKRYQTIKIHAPSDWQSNATTFMDG